MEKNESSKETFPQKKNSEETKLPEEEKIIVLQTAGNNGSCEGKEKIVTIEVENKEPKEFKTNKLVLNYFWIQLVSSISLAVSLIIYEIIIIFAGDSIVSLLKREFKALKEALDMLLQEIGLKWLFIINISHHLSLGFFCLTNFSYILKETKKPLKFFLINIIKCLLYYLLSIIIMKYIKNYFFDVCMDEINKVDGLSQDIKDEIFQVINEIKKITTIYLDNLLSNYNNSLDKLIMGLLYIFLFSSPKIIKKENILCFRLISIIPILYILFCLTLRILNNLGIITLSIYISPILVGPKITIFGFFITVLLYMRIKKNKYKMFDEEDNLLPNVFSKISSKTFSVFGFIELIIGLFLPSLKVYGIGNHYLVILCSPIMMLYDYKKKYEKHIKPCPKINIAKYINILVFIILYAIIVILGVAVLGIILELLLEYIRPVVQFIVNHFEKIMQIINLIYLLFSLRSQ